jgi:hypothetical protein
MTNDIAAILSHGADDPNLNRWPSLENSQIYHVSLARCLCSLVLILS